MEFKEERKVKDWTLSSHPSLAGVEVEGLRGLGSAAVRRWLHLLRSCAVLSYGNHAQAGNTPGREELAWPLCLGLRGEVHA